jgi:hypothetical protein
MLAQIATLISISQTQAQTAQMPLPYPAMAPLDQYLMRSEDSEIALARSAAPESISDGADVMVLGSDGYTTAVKGRNGFVCMVQRSWTGPDDPQFWNPKIRAPICFNAAAARTYLPITLMKTKLVLAEKSKDEMFQTVESALDKKELPALEPGAMCYMMSKQQYLTDHGPKYHPHLMFFIPGSVAAGWGANLSGSPIFAGDDPQDRMTVFMIPVKHWSDGTADSPGQN